MRSASATVRCARCSTSRTARPRSRIAASASKTTSTTRRREPERRLVEQQDVRLGDERAGDRELLLLAARERARLPAAELLDDREELVDAAQTPLRRRRARAAPRDRAAGSPRPSARRRCACPPGTSATPLRATSSGRRPSSDASPSRTSPPVDRRDAHDRVQRRRLAGAVRADQADDLARARPRTRGRAPRRTPP